MRLKRIEVKNFKGIGLFESDFGSENIIEGENGVGKTSVYDAWLWLLFGKNSEGRSDFKLRPYDNENNAVEGLVVMVEATVEVAGETVTLKKEQHENVVKGKVTGFTTKCWINEVPKKVGQSPPDIRQPFSALR